LKALLAPTNGGLDVLVVTDVPEPSMNPGGARVAIDAASVNFPDVLMIAGKYQLPQAPPFVPGCEFCGRVVEVSPDVTTVHPGDVVLGIGVSGAFAEEIVIEASRLTKMPGDVDPLAVAAFGIAYITSYYALRTVARVERDEWVVVLGAAGGVGLAAVEIAKLLGAKVLAAASDDEKLAVAREKGADATVNYSNEDLKLRIRDLTDGGADVVIDPVGGSYSEPALRSTRWNGRFVVVGFASGEIPRIPLNLLLLKGMTVTGFENRTIEAKIPAVAAEHRRELFGYFARGELVPHISAVYPLSDARQALEVVAERRVIGKVVIDIAAGR
jgi:NADPH2:quinone reductase